MKTTSGIGNTAVRQKRGVFSAHISAFFFDFLSLDSVMYFRLIAAGVLLLGGIITRSAWPAVSVVLSLAVIVIVGCDTLICFVSNIIGRHIITEDISIIFAVLFSCWSGHFCEGAAMILLYRIIQFAIRSLSAKVSSTGNSRPGDKTVSAVSLGAFTAALVLGIAFGFFFKLSPRFFLAQMAMLQLCISPVIIFSINTLADVLALKSLSTYGFVFHSERIMKKCARVKSVVIDKEQLLDNDELCVIESSSKRIGDEILLRIAAHACAYSDTGYAKAVMAAYKGTVYIDLVQSFQEDDAGITVTVDGVPIIFGLTAYLSDAGIDIEDNNTDARAMFLAINGEYAGRILFGDKPAVRVENIAAALEHIHVEPILFTDGTLTAGKAFADSVGIKRFFASPISRSALLRDIRKEQKRELLLYAFSRKDDDACIEACDISAGFGGGHEKCDIEIAENSPEMIFTLLKTARDFRAALAVNIGITCAAAVITVILIAFRSIVVWQALAFFVAAAVLSAVLSVVLISR